RSRPFPPLEQRRKWNYQEGPGAGCQATGSTVGLGSLRRSITNYLGCVRGAGRNEDKCSARQGRGDAIRLYCLEATLNKEFKLLAVLAHPDDESLGFGGTFAKYAAEGIETYLVTATRGERGRFGPRGERGDPVEVGRVREAELRAAAAVLGIREV